MKNEKNQNPETLRLTVRADKKSGMYVVRGNWDSRPTGIENGGQWLATRAEAMRYAIETEAAEWIDMGYGDVKINGVLLVPVVPVMEKTLTARDSETGRLVNVINPGFVRAPQAVNIQGVPLMAIGRGTNFEWRISREEAGRLLSLPKKDLPGGRLPFDIMCAEYGDDSEWAGITAEDCEEGPSGALELDTDWQTLEIWEAPRQDSSANGESRKCA